MQGVTSSSIPIPSSNTFRGIGDHPSTTASTTNPPATAGGTVTSPNASGAGSGNRPRRPRSRRDRDRRFTCDVEGCDKTYTRAEHLTRHQLNRKSSLLSQRSPFGHLPRLKADIDNGCRPGGLQIRLPSRSTLRQKVRSRRFAHPP